MTDQLEARLRGMLTIGDTSIPTSGPMILKADEIAEIVAALTRLRERERRMESALLRIMAVLPGGEAFHIALEAVCPDEDAFNATAAPTPEEVERG